MTSKIVVNNIEADAGISTVAFNDQIRVGSATTIHSTGIDLGSGNINSHNINSSGIVTAIGLDINGNGDISGNLNVAGVLTYEDVTSVDAVGLSTFQAGIHVTGGSVGIGTAVPNEELHIHASGTSYIRFTDETSGTGGTDGAVFGLDHPHLYAWNYEAGDFVVATNATEKLRITSAGFVGVNTDNPAAKLDVLHGAIRLSRTATYTSHAEFGITHNNPSDYGSLYFDNSNATGDYVFRTTSSNTERLRITAAGNVDINGTPPWTVTGGNYRNLSISGEGASASGFLWLGNGAAATNADFDLGRVNFVNGANIVAQIKGTTQTGANDDGRISFNTKTSGSNIAERLRITSDGHVIPASNNVYDLGSVTNGWRNIYSNDLNLSNMDGDSNDIDGTNGSWTIQEGKDDLFIINRLTGKKYKINLTEVS